MLMAALVLPMYRPAGEQLGTILSSKPIVADTTPPRLPPGSSVYSGQDFTNQAVQVGECVYGGLVGWIESAGVWGVWCGVGGAARNYVSRARWAIHATGRASLLRCRSQPLLQLFCCFSCCVCHRPS
jgi:hypothetical protein